MLDTLPHAHFHLPGLTTTQIRRLVAQDIYVYFVFQFQGILYLLK